MATPEDFWIEFTQFLLPDGRKQIVRIFRSAEVVEKAKQIVAAGLHFEVEVLTNGMVSLTITGKNRDVSIRLCTNDEAVLAAVDDLVTSFDIEKGLKYDECDG